MRKYAREVTRDIQRYGQEVRDVQENTNAIIWKNMVKIFEDVVEKHERYE